jgi:hypothetical protein
MVVPPWDTVKVTEPPFTVPAVLATVAVNVTFWLPLLTLAEAFAAVVVVGACTVVVAMLRYCWLLELSFAALTYTPTPGDAPVTCKLALLPDASVPNEQLNT